MTKVDRRERRCVCNVVRFKPGLHCGLFYTFWIESRLTEFYQFCCFRDTNQVSSSFKLPQLKTLLPRSYNCTCDNVFIALTINSSCRIWIHSYLYLRLHKFERSAPRKTEPEPVMQSNAMYSHTMVSFISFAKWLILCCLFYPMKVVTHVNF